MKLEYIGLANEVVARGQAEFDERVKDGMSAKRVRDLRDGFASGAIAALMAFEKREIERERELKKNPSLTGVHLSGLVWIKRALYYTDRSPEQRVKSGTRGDFQVFELSRDGRIIHAFFVPEGLEGGVKVFWPEWDFG
jgi:hypothetical protein